MWNGWGGGPTIGQVAALGLFLGGVSGAWSSAAAQQTPRVELTRIRGADIELDGMPDESAWAEVPALPLTMYSPTFRGQPGQRTEIRVGYDDEYLYAAGWFYDDDPMGIRVNSLYRDRWSGDDAFAIYIDAFNDNQNAKWFGTTPAGIRFDILLSADGATQNSSWDTFWQSETRITDRGWFAEVRIPFSSLGFQVGDGDLVVMGLTVTRLVSRTGERVTWPAIDPRFQFRQPSVAQDVTLRGVTSGRPVYVTPYALTGLDQRPTLSDAGTAFSTSSDFSAEIGGDLRYALSGNLTLDATVNTDFAQVEADEQQVNLDRFSLFFPEKRRFFQEYSGNFDFYTGNGSRLFHTRQIGLTADREPVPVLGGVRLAGRLGEWDLGVLEMQTDALGGSPSENFGAARMRRRVFNPYSNAGGMITTRLSAGRYNVAYGADGLFRVFGDDYATLKWAGSFDDQDPEGIDFLDRSHAYASWERRVSDGLAYTLSFTRSGSAYQPDLGFLPRRDYTRAAVYANWYRFTNDHPYFRRVWPGMLAFSTFRNSDGVLESGQYAVWVQWDTKAGGGGSIEPKLFVEDVLEPFSIGGEVEIPAGHYHYTDLQINVSMPAGRKLRSDVDARFGGFFDGTRQQITIKPTWNISPHLELGGEYEYSRLRFDKRDQGTDIHLVRLRIRTALNARASGNAFVQYNSTTDLLGVNVRLRYNFSEGTDLWLVYNEGLLTERLPDPGTPRLPLSTSRVLQVKFSYTMGL